MSGVVTLSVQSGDGFLYSGQVATGANPFSMMVASGMVFSGAIWGISPGAVVSGMSSTSTIIGNCCCAKCGKQLGWMQGDKISVHGISGLHQQWCWCCAGYKYVCEEGGVTGRFETVEVWIRESVPLESGTPAGIIADWLTDQSRYREADYMREVADREMRMSGG